MENSPHRFKERICSKKKVILPYNTRPWCVRMYKTEEDDEQVDSEIQNCRLPTSESNNKVDVFG